MSQVVIQWVLDTRNLWPAATTTKDLPNFAVRAFALLTTQERVSVLKYYFVRDAKVALISIIIKRHLISHYLKIPWDEAIVTRDERTKPIFKLPDRSEPLIFNITHQAGLVGLIAVLNPPSTRDGFAIGIDLVCQSERVDRDHNMIENEGWDRFVDMHEEVFSPTETATLKAMPLDNDGKLEYFYALWCLREAYVKMTGEALLAKWLRELDMRGFAPPGRTPVGNQASLSLYMGDEKVNGVDMHLTHILDVFMVCAAVRSTEAGESIEIKDFESLDIDQVLASGERAKGLRTA